MAWERVLNKKAKGEQTGSYHKHTHEWPRARGAYGSMDVCVFQQQQYVGYESACSHFNSQQASLLLFCVFSWWVIGVFCVALSCNQDAAGGNAAV